MFITSTWRHLAVAALAGCAIAVAALSAPIVIGSLTPANAQPVMAQQMSEEFEAALESYGAWRPHPRYGMVWVPAGVPRDWRPYEYGHWVYTDDWGWYWVSDEAEEDWGWVAYHYGRWAFERGVGWFWVPGDEWAPAWVDWRYGEDTIGWAALPPDDLIDAYEAEPALWIFVPGRYMTAPRLRTYIFPAQRRAAALRATRLVNRTFVVRGARLAVNPGISPAFVARVTKTALPSYRVRPRVFASTQGVSGAVHVKTEELRAVRPGGRAHVNAVSVTPTTTVIRPLATAPVPQGLGKGERGQLGSHPPRAAQGGGAPGGVAPGGGTPQQQAPATGPAGPVPPAGTPSRPGPRPGAAPAAPPSSLPAAAPIAPPSSPPAAAPLRPPAGSAPTGRQGEPPPQAKPVRPIAPQTPPPPPAARPAPPPPPPAPVQQRQPPPPPPAAARPALPPPPPPPAARPVPPPPPPAARPAVPLKPGEKPPEVPK